jgi:hypothetical protein
LLSADFGKFGVAEYRSATATLQVGWGVVLATWESPNYYGSQSFCCRQTSRTDHLSVGLDNGRSGCPSCVVPTPRAARLELITILFVLGVVLTVVTLVGHGIWVLMSYIFGAPSARSVTPPGTKMTDRPGALLAMRQLVDEYWLHGSIDRQTHARLIAAIDEERQQVAQETSALAAPPVTVPAEPEVILTPVASAVPSAEPATIEESAIVPAPAGPSSMPLAERAREYAANREVAMTEALAEPVPPEPRQKREALSRLFAAFMEEKNIRWGELVGGMLIVGCSIALVISFWSQIAARPLLKFVLFNGVTAALFGVGFYTQRRWKIHTTSRGVLLIAMLLVPLNFLAIAAFTQDTPPTDLLSLAGEGLSLAIFALLVYFAGRVLTPNDALWLAAGVMAPCLMQLLVRRFAGPETSLGVVYVLAGVPVIAYLISTAVATHRRWQAGAAGSASAAPPLNELEANRLLLFLGVVSAAAVMPLALLLNNAPPVRTTLHWLSPLVLACGLPALVVGLLFWRRITDRALAGLQTAGIGVGALGVLVMVAAVVLAWPDPATLLPVALFIAAAMAAVALRFGIPAAYLPAGLALAAAWLIGFHLARGDVGWTIEGSEPIKAALFSAASGHALAPLAALFGAIAWWFARRRVGATLSATGSAIATGSEPPAESTAPALAEPVTRKVPEAAFMISIVAAITAAASLILLLWFGFARKDDPHQIIWTLSIYAFAGLVVALVLNNVVAARIGSALCLATLVQAVVYRFNPTWQFEQPWVAALLLHSTLIGLLCAVLVNIAVRLPEPWALAAARRVDVLRILVFTAQITSLVGAAWIAFRAPVTPAGAMMISLMWLAGVWFLLAALDASPSFFTASQAALVLAIASGVIIAVELREWYQSAAHPWLDPYFVQGLGIVLAAYCVAFGLARWAFGRAIANRAEQVVDTRRRGWLDALSSLFDPPWPTVDRVVEVVVIGLLLLVAIYAASPGIAQELSPTQAAGDRVVTPIEQFEIAGIAHIHAAQIGGWLLLAGAAIMLAVTFWLGPNSWRVIGMVITAMAICPLLAARWEPDVAVASALRWLSAAFFAMASVPVWLTRSASPQSNSWLQPMLDGEINNLARHLRDLLVAFAVLIYFAMGAYIGEAVMAFTSIDRRAWPWVFTWALIAGVGALIAAYAAAETGLQRNREGDVFSRAATWHARNVLVLLAVAPAAILLAFAAAQALIDHPLVGPEPGSWFQRIGNEVSFGVPLLIIALAFIGYAIRERSSGFAFTAGLLFNAVATMVVLLRFAHSGATLDAAAWIVVAQVNAIVAGIVALVWRGALAFSERKTGVPAPHAPAWPMLLQTQVALAAALCATFFIPAVSRLAVGSLPTAAIPSWAGTAGSPLGWGAVALAIAATGWLNWGRSFSQLLVALIVATLVSMIALTTLWLGRSDWPAYHTLLVGCCAAAWLMPLLTQGANRLFASADLHEMDNRWSALPVRAFGIAAVWLALWENSTATSWWVIAALMAVGLRNIAVAWREGGRGSMWVAALLITLAMSIWWLGIVKAAAAMRGVGDGFAFLWVDVLAVAVVAVVSVIVERRRVGLASGTEPMRRGIAFHRFAAWAIVTTLLLTTTVGLIADLTDGSTDVNWALAWGAWLAAALVAAACLWDSAIRWSVACLYLVGLIAVGMYLDGLDLHAPLFHWALANALAAFALATSALWSVRERLGAAAARYGVPVAPSAGPHAAWDAGSGHAWLVPANILIGVGVLLLVCFIELTMPNFTHRMVVAYAVGAQAFAIGLLARGAVRTPLQYLALVWGVLFAIAFAWAFLPPNFAEPWLHRLVVTVVALALTIVVYSFSLVKFLKRENEWTRAAERLVPSLAGLATALILVVLGIEVVDYAHAGNVPIANAALVAVILALAGLAAAAIVAALVPGRDPLGLSESGRALYVYIAEAFAGLMFLHIRVTMPWLFQGWFLRFWPLVVMVIAFVGVGLSEVFQRRRQRVLSEPLETTGALLPLLPALGFWVMSSEVNYSLLLLSIGVFYAALSVLRKSFWYGTLAAVAANGSLWYFLARREGLGLVEHPQLWLIPPALCALVAGYINRERLTLQQSAALRYASAIVIYVSSTADIFINGVAEAPWLPGVLAGLSILGVLAGILFRIQSFLYLGIAFLVVAIMTIIWHAADQHTWIWWVTGIVTGALIIALFGLFEKRRDDVLRVVEELKHWQA